MPPDGDPNAMTRSFDAFLPAPYAAEPDSSSAPGGGEIPAADPSYFAYPPSADPLPPVKSGGPKGRTVAIIAGAVLLVCGVGVGAYALGSSASSSGGSSVAAGAPASGATDTAGKAHTKVQTARLTITAIDGNTLTGTTAGGANITVDITSDTRFGTKAKPLTASQLTVGELVIVRGQRSGTGTYTATEIAMAPSTVPGTGGAITATPSATTPST